MSVYSCYNITKRFIDIPLYYGLLHDVCLYEHSRVTEPCVKPYKALHQKILEINQLGTKSCTRRNKFHLNV